MKKISIGLLGIFFATSLAAQTVQIANQIYDYHMGDKSKEDIILQVYDSDDFPCFPEKNYYTLKFGKVLNLDTSKQNSPCKTIKKIIVANSSIKDYYQGGAIIKLDTQFFPYITQIMVSFDSDSHVILDEQGEVVAPGLIEVKQLWRGDNRLTDSTIEYIQNTELPYFLKKHA